MVANCGICKTTETLQINVDCLHIFCRAHSQALLSARRPCPVCQKPLHVRPFKLPKFHPNMLIGFTDKQILEAVHTASEFLTKQLEVEALREKAEMKRLSLTANEMQKYYRSKLEQIRNSGGPGR
jgi:hypothetical protein